MQTSNSLDILTAIATLLTLWLLYKTLKSEHDWRRRQSALELNQKWIETGMISASLIEKKFPHIRYHGNEQDKNELTKAKAHEVYTNTSDESVLEVRKHIIGLLNQMDYIAMAYFNGVADTDIIDLSMKLSITAWYHSFQNFISIVQELEGQKYWHTLQELISYWEKNKKVKIRKPTA